MSDDGQPDSRCRITFNNTLRSYWSEPVRISPSRKH